MMYGWPRPWPHGTVIRCASVPSWFAVIELDNGITFVAKTILLDDPAVEGEDYQVGHIWTAHFGPFIANWLPIEVGAEA